MTKPYSCLLWSILFLCLSRPTHSFPLKKSKSQKNILLNKKIESLESIIQKDRHARKNHIIQTGSGKKEIEIKKNTILVSE